MRALPINVTAPTFGAKLAELTSTVWGRPSVVPIPVKR
jgi:hypothetical protein